MNEILRRLASALQRLSPRERSMLVALAVVLASVTAYAAVVAPLARRHERLRRGIETLSNDLVAMQALQARIRQLEASLGDDGEDSQDGSFSLFSFIDRVTSAAVESENIESMNPSRRQLKPGLEEEVVDLRLSRVTLSAIVSVLESIEESGKPVYAKQLDIKRRYDDRTRFDVTLLAATLVRS